MSATPPRNLVISDLPRVNEISLVLAKNGFGHILTLLGLAAPPAPGNAEAQTAPFARRVRQVLVDLGPTFVKLGQVLALRPDILTPDLQAEFESLQDRVPPMSPEDFRSVLESELPVPVAEVFTEIDDLPLGSASIAQVHRARLVSGEEVAIKVQRRGIERRIRSDMHILYALAQLVEGSVAIPGLLTPTAIVREFDVAIHKELDFTEELHNAERIARQMADLDGVTVPLVYPRWSSRRLLVMERIIGDPVSVALHEWKGERARKLAHRLMEATYRQVFEHGLFHGDPHPGNLFVDTEDRLVYLDFGLVGQLSGAMQDTLINVFTSMVFRDAETLAMSVYRAGATKGRVDLRAFTEELDRNMTRYYGASLDDLANRTTFMEVVQLCTKYHISLPPEFAVLSRAITLVEGSIRGLLPGVDIVAEVRPYAQRLVERRFSPDRVAHDTARLMLQAQGHFRDVPQYLAQFMMDVEAGTITIITRDPDSHRLREEIRAAVLRLSLAALATTVTLGSMLFLAAWSPEPWEVPIFGLLGLMSLGAGAALFGALGLHVFFAGLIDLGAWRRRLFGFLRFFSLRRS